MSPENETPPNEDTPDPSGDHTLLRAEGRVLSKVREVARRITEQVRRTLRSNPPERPPDANPPALA